MGTLQTGLLRRFFRRFWMPLFRQTCSPLRRRLLLHGQQHIKPMWEILEQERTPGTEEPPHDEWVGFYWHTTNALSLQVCKANGSLNLSIHRQRSQEHTLSHYHYDSFIFLPTADDGIRRGLFHFNTKGWLIHFERDSDPRYNRLVGSTEAQAPRGEVFIKA